MELFAVQQCSRELPSVMVVRIPSGFKSRKKTLFNSLQKIQTLYLSLKMFKLIATILFAHVLLAAPLPQYQVKRAFPNDCGLFTPQKCHGYLTQNHHVDHHEAPVEDDFLSTAGTSH